MWAKHLDKEETLQSLIKALGFDYDGITPATAVIHSFRWHDCNMNGTVCDVVMTAWGEPETFKARWDTTYGWMFEGDAMPDFID